MGAIAVRTEVYAPVEVVFDFLRDFPGYAEYSPYLKAVRQYGEGGEGTEYELDAAWWRFEYTARTEVTRIVEDERIEWRTVDDVDAHGLWIVDPSRPDGATGVTLYIAYDAGSARSATIDLPRFLSLETVINRAKPVVKREAKATVERIVADLEGEPREVDIDIDTDPEPPDQ